MRGKLALLYFFLIIKANPADPVKEPDSTDKSKNRAFEDYPDQIDDSLQFILRFISKAKPKYLSSPSGSLR